MPKSKKKTTSEDAPKRKTRSAASEPEQQPEAAPASDAAKKTKKKKSVFHPKSYSGFLLKIAKKKGVSLKGDVLAELDAATHFLVNTLISRSKRIIATRKQKVETIKPAAITAAIHTMLPASNYKTALLAAAAAGIDKLTAAAPTEGGEEVAA